MAPDVIAAIAAVLLALVGIVGIIVPVLPGSITVAIALLVWAIFGGGWAWLFFAVGVVIVGGGMISGWVLTKRGMDAKEIPNWPVLVGAAAGVVGIFVIPAFGLPIGFMIGLVISEYIRLKDWREALSTSWIAAKSLGIGMLIEFSCATFALFLLGVSIAGHFALGR